MKLTHDAQTTKAVAQLVGYAFNKQHALDQDEIFLSRYKHADLYGETNEQEVTSFILVDRFKVHVPRQGHSIGTDPVPTHCPYQA